MCVIVLSQNPAAFIFLYQWYPKTPREIWRNMGICEIFTEVAGRENISFYICVIYALLKIWMTRHMSKEPDVCASCHRPDSKSAPRRVYLPCCVFVSVMARHDKPAKLITPLSGGGDGTLTRLAYILFHSNDNNTCRNDKKLLVS